MYWTKRKGWIIKEIKRTYSYLNMSQLLQSLGLSQLFEQYDASCEYDKPHSLVVISDLSELSQQQYLDSCFYNAWKP